MPLPANCTGSKHTCKVKFNTNATKLTCIQEVYSLYRVCQDLAGEITSSMLKKDMYLNKVMKGRRQSKYAYFEWVLKIPITRNYNFWIDTYLLNEL